jgi:hypothetical protein
VESENLMSEPLASPPPSPRRTDRRVEPRRPCRLDVTCQSRLVGEAFGPVWSAAVDDVSHEGICLHTRRPVPVGAELAVTLPDLPGLRGGRRLRARVTNARRDTERGGYALGCAFAGEELSPVQLSSLLLAPPAPDGKR